MAQSKQNNPNSENGSISKHATDEHRSIHSEKGKKEPETEEGIKKDQKQEKNKGKDKEGKTK